MAEITMPRLSDTMSEGAVGQWLKKPGDRVEVGDIIAEIETDKAVMELEAFDTGTLLKILVPEGQVVPIGTPIALVGEGEVETEPSSEAGSPETLASPATEARLPVIPTSLQLPDQTAKEGDGHIKASPVARRLAEERGIDLRGVRGTGPGGRIIKENVEDFQSETARIPQPIAQPVPAVPTPVTPPASTPSAEATPLSRMRRAIARVMTEAQPGTPHIYVTVEIDMAEAMKLRQQINDSGAADVKISVNDMVVKAAAKALHKFPALNSSYATGSDSQPAIVQHWQINVSIAVALEDGLVAPVVRDADKKALGAVAAEIKELAGRAREGKLKQQELEGPTFQVSNLGMYRVLAFTSIIPAPLAASLSVGAVRQTPVVREGQLTIGEIMDVTLSVDHRIADGAIAAQYLQELRRLLESPISLLI
ncbi:MAG: dihydrolipoamide acetyltransferase component of pyruvate dehydrogenase complex [Chloroflexota bacterium]|nr:MAG: dihydrolipoamide acetyltransferase component of pyruvate dehydrogenase complex [Chloroflexota bacterium]